jgi:chromosome segregation ATPase
MAPKDRDDDLDDDIDDVESAADKADGKGKAAAQAADKGDKDDKAADQEQDGEFIDVDLTDEEIKDNKLDIETQADEKQGSETDDEKRERRRREKRERRERQRQARDTTTQQLRELKARNDMLERAVLGIDGRIHQQSLTTLQSKQAELKSQIAEATRIIAHAGSAGNGEALAKAMELRDEARDELRGVNAYLTRVSRETPDKRQQAPAQDAAVATRVAAFKKDFPWYDAENPDEDSRIVTELDNRVAQAGYHPGSEAYWETLKKLIARNLPHRAADADDDADDDDADDDTASRGKPNGRQANGHAAGGAARGPKVGAGARSSSSGKAQFYVSPARKQAMVDAGIWDDPEKRKRQIIAYARYDKEQGGTAR